MVSIQSTLRCHYRYDPLDRLINQTQPDTPVHQRFYCKSRLATEIQGAIKHTIFQHGNLLLAQQLRQDDAVDTTLLATDLQRSVLHTLKANYPLQPITYSPYGHRRPDSGLTSLLGFNGERPDPVTGHYLLGNGYRAFNPVLMRFNSPDSLSPFKKGGLNSYSYCFGDPVNFNDPTGHTPSGLINSLLKITDLNSDVFNKIVKLLPGPDVANMRLVSRDIKIKVDIASNHHFKIYMNNPRYFRGTDIPLTPLDKIVVIGAGRVHGVASAQAGLTLNKQLAFSFFPAFASPGQYITDKSLIDGSRMILDSMQPPTNRPNISRRHSLDSYDPFSRNPSLYERPSKLHNREGKKLRSIRRGSEDLS